MSRTKKGKKGPGHEYWSKRPGNKGGGIPGKEIKKRTHKLERLEEKLKLERILDHNTHDDYDDYDDGEWGSWSLPLEFDWDD